MPEDLFNEDNTYVLNENADFLVLESSVYTEMVSLNNYQGFKVGDGMSLSEKIR